MNISNLIFSLFFKLILDDYEEYVDDRENALWDKIDVLVAKLEREISPL